MFIDDAQLLRLAADELADSAFRKSQIDQNQSTKDFWSWKRTFYVHLQKWLPTDTFGEIPNNIRVAMCYEGAVGCRGVFAQATDNNLGDQVIADQITFVWHSLAHGAYKAHLDKQNWPDPFAAEAAEPRRIEGPPSVIPGAAEAADFVAGLGGFDLNAA